MSLHLSDSPRNTHTHTETKKKQKNTHKPNVWWKCLCNLNSGCALKKPIHLFHINPISSLTDRAQWCGLPGYCCYYCRNSILRLNNSLTRTRKVMRGVFMCKCSGIKSSRVSIILTKQIYSILFCVAAAPVSSAAHFLFKFLRERFFFFATEGCDMFKTIRHRCYSNSMSLIIFSLINICWSQTKTEHTDNRKFAQKHTIRHRHGNSNLTSSGRPSGKWIRRHLSGAICTNSRTNAH